MRKKFLLISTILVISASAALVACGKKSPSSPESSVSSDKTTQEETSKGQTVATTETKTEGTTEAVKKDDIATKQDEKAKPKEASGTFEGWADSSSVEIKMSDGEYQTFFVEKEEVKKVLNEKGEGASISFTYGALEGQVNKQILSVK